MEKMAIIFLPMMVAMVTSRSFDPYDPIGPICPMIACDRNSCKSGFRRNSNGCTYCQCTDPCEQYRCLYPNQKCVSRYVKWSDDYPEAHCTSPKDPNYVCPRASCYRFCQSGFRVDDMGCMTCVCQDPCESETWACPRGQVCSPKKVQCLKEPCYDVPLCHNDTSICPTLKCHKLCKSGYQTSSNGCPSCTCNSLCQEYPDYCPPGEYCVDKGYENCKYPPCNLGRICVHKKYERKEAGPAF
ncbi:hypothetical protein HELRODRAFT_194976 [Helobdella robusta]|uniref:Antistasin-like domain-containing protein n=1 Tax=Helobdella robusta TaxID=6412 RepID=T1FWM3_HELRO|nr:hypothetical protein HELRODRAFT_194976 [Helobdella robusta]ESO10312.1 hypothetical protein HELRODRAFT_194976 [Helobdella robusta]